MTTRYRTPLQDYRFLLDELVPGCMLDDGERSWAAYGAVLEAAGRFCEDVLEPLNRSGDEEGCHFENGGVRTPKGFREAYARLLDGGWASIKEGEGDGAISTAAAFCIDETVGAANLAFSNYLGPTKRVAQALAPHAEGDLKRLYLDPLIAGVWAGTLCLTEPHCGTDLGLIRTRAETGQGTEEYLLSGTKIFVTSGEHDLTPNIVHLVLARMADAPPGVRGLSLFLVPKFTRQGAGADRNGVQCAGIEHKMGIKASATCTLKFEQARGILLAGTGEGLRSIFPVMERERLSIALQSVGLAEHAYQKARDYARERLQGRATTGAKFPHLAADPIVVHADVRRMLLTMRAYTEGGRALLIWTGSQIDRARREPDAQRRRAAADFVQLVTPMTKAFLTDLGVETTNLGIQVMGGHGYVRESGMEQLARDARVTQLYAGANGVQALDLVARKLPARSGQMLDLFTSPVEAIMSSWHAHPGAKTFTDPLFEGLEKLKRATRFIREEGARDPDLAAAAGYAYLQLFGHVALSFLWAHAALTASERLRSRAGSQSQAFYEAKVATGQFYLQHLLPGIERCLQSIAAGSRAIMQPDAEAF